MKISYERISKIFPAINQRPLTEEEFWHSAQAEKIIVSEADFAADGYYQRRGNKCFILINKRLRGMFWLRTAYHELTHHFLTPPDMKGFKQYRTPLLNIGKEEQIADAIGTIAVLPFADAFRYANEDLSDCEEFGKLVHERLKIYLDHGI